MIDVQGISFSYPHRHQRQCHMPHRFGTQAAAVPPFIDDLSYSFNTGKITTIVGPNGCGKSTLIKLITQFLTPQQGIVTLDGANTKTLGTKDFARRVSLLAQSTSTPNMEVSQLVMCGRYPHQGFATPASTEDKRIVAEALALTGCGPFTGKNVKNLSGGEKQRVFLAMALAQDTDVIILDEPTTYLDIHATGEVMDLIRTLNKDLGKTIIMVLHDLQYALTHSHQIVVMQKGRILASGDRDAIIANGAIEEAFSIDLKRFTDPANPNREYYCFNTPNKVPDP